MKFVVVGVFLLAALTSCQASKNAYLAGCKDGIYLALDSIGVAPEQVDPERVKEACDKAQSAKKSE